ncbi:uncharacterized protein LOC122647193 [Telopea speciosissima]|uniref:uncharacterized protein LOC122647193 n=1 Tax=Telopea speciosissima TaxID=54955 RepID=UPI001CC569CA|nr:uncharacterized protein LOC122647193 [Telopea speciosissima]
MDQMVELQRNFLQGILIPPRLPQARERNPSLEHNENHNNANNARRKDKEVQGNSKHQGSQMTKVEQALNEKILELQDQIQEGASNAIMCRAFPSTLKGATRQWFLRLRSRSLTNFVELGRGFLAHFVGSRVHKRTAANLLATKQRPDESIRDFLTRFNKEALEVQNLNQIVKFQALRSVIRDVELKRSLIMDEPMDMYELFSRYEKHINLVEVLAAEQEKEGKLTQVGKNGPKHNRDQKEGKRTRDDRDWVTKNDSGLEPIYTALTHNRAYMLNEIKDQVTLHWPTKMIKPTHECNKSKYYRFHQDHGQDTKDCRQLKDEIEALIQRGRLSRFVKKDGGERR